MDKEWEDAVWRGDAGRAAHLLQSGADINSKDRYGQTGLMVAALQGHLELTTLFLERGAEMNHAAKYNLSALMLAVINNHPEIVRLLAEAGADRTIRGTDAPGFAGLTAFDLAEKADRREIAAILRS